MLRSSIGTSTRTSISTTPARRRLTALLPVLLLTLAAATGCGDDAQAEGGAAGSGEGRTLRVGFISNTPTPAGPEGWADHTGTLLPGLADAGVGDVSWLPFKNGPDLSAAISGGSVDLALIGDTPGLTAKATGLPTRLVNQANVGLDAWLFVRKGGASSIADLAGTTVATQVGSYMYRYLLARLDEEGVTNEVEVSHVYTTDAVASLGSGGVEAYAAPAGPLTDVLEKQGFEAIEKASEHDLVGSSLTLITDDALAALPDLPAAWNDVRAEAVEDLTAQAEDYYAFAAEATGTTADVVEAALPVSLYSPEPFTDRGLELLQGTNEFLADKELIESPVDLDAWQVD